MEKIRVVIAEDHVFVREATRQLLEREPDIGIEATGRIKAVRPGTAVLILTQYDDDQYVFAMLGAGAAGYLLKDVPSTEVVRAVRAVHAGEPVLPPDIARKP